MNSGNSFFTILLVSILLLPAGISAQCMTYPVSLEERVQNANHIVLGKLKDKIPYYGPGKTYIYTLNIIEVEAFLKGNTGQTEVAVITSGGFLNNEGWISTPSLEIDPWNEYILFLESDNFEIDNDSVRIANPSLIQSRVYSSVQGAITKQGGYYHDLHGEPRQTEEEIFEKIKLLTSEKAQDPGHRTFAPRKGDTFPLSQWQGRTNKVTAITSFSPDPTISGTIDTVDAITINGSGFGSSAGNVFYSNADDGGATFTASGVGSDNISWSSTQVHNKVARRGGTGVIQVNGNTSSSNLNIDYAHIEINSSFFNWVQTTRQRYYLADKDGNGGYIYYYNANMNAVSGATDAFERAFEEWRCNTFVNFEIDTLQETNVNTVASDDTSAIFFDGSLPAGVLGRANSNFQASANGSCDSADTFWYLSECDIQMKTDPPAGCCTWNYGPGATTASEFDFESVALHELGHAHGLGHVIDAGAVMHYSISNGTDARTVSANDINGGSAKVTYSTNSANYCLTPGSINGPMTALNSGNCAVLPVDWNTIHGNHKQGVGNQISWTVINEVNNKEFEVQRSFDGLKFETIAIIPGRGNSASFRTYRYTDIDLRGKENFLYRIAQIDFDGNRSYSDVVEISLENVPFFNLYPTLNNGIIHYSSRNLNLQNTNLIITDVRGKTVSKLPLNPNQTSSTINLQHLNSGIYFYRISGHNNNFSGKMIIHRD